ncbi:YcfA family protein [Arthrospira platensis C1]|nr:YcfA family protein [Arthrospira platensis C1]
MNPNTGQASVLPDWGSRDLKIGTLRSALRQLGIDWDVFNNT